MDREKIKCGNIVYTYWNINSIIERCEIIDINQEEEYVILKCLDLGGETRRYFDQIFSTEEETKLFMNKQDQEIQEEYAKEINSIEDLIRFIYTNTVALCEEYTDWNARIVAKNKAKELANIDLE